MDFLVIFASFMLFLAILTWTHCGDDDDQDGFA